MRVILPTILLLSCVLIPAPRKRDHLMSTDRFPAMLTNGQAIRHANTRQAELAAAERALTIAEHNYTVALVEQRPVNELARLHGHLFLMGARVRIAKERAGVV